jgi:hypothetical protein
MVLEQVLMFGIILLQKKQKVVQSQYAIIVIKFIHVIELIMVQAHFEDI